MLLFRVMVICHHYLETHKGSILNLQASILSDHGPPRLFFEPVELLNFAFNGIRIQLF
jgi:hypothetical protein